MQFIQMQCLRNSVGRMMFVGSQNLEATVFILAKMSIENESKNEVSLSDSRKHEAVFRKGVHKEIFDDSYTHCLSREKPNVFNQQSFPKGNYKAN